MKAEPFFIIGSQRGGTTLLRLMLNKHSEIIIPPESHFFIPLLQKFSTQDVLTKEDQYEAANIISSHSRFEGWKIDKKELIKIVELLPEKTYLSDLIRSIFEYKLNDKKIWGDKTPEYIDILPGIVRLFPHAYFILLIRDGRDVSVSLKARGWQGWTVYQRAKYWQKCIKNIVGLTNTNIKSIIIKYEDLVTKSEKCLRSLCNFLNVEYEEAMMDFYKDYDKHITKLEMESGVHAKLERPTQPDDAYKWKKNLNRRSEIWRFESVCYRELIKTGYEISYFKKFNPFHQIARISYSVNGMLLSLAYKFYHLVFSKNQKIKNKRYPVFTTFRQVVRRQ